MRFKIEILLLLLPALVFPQNSLMEFFREIAGRRDFVVDGSLSFHVKDANGNFHDFEISGILMINNLENICLHIDKPNMLSGVSFSYIGKYRRVYSGYEGKYDMSAVSLKENFVEDLFLAFVDIITSPFFRYSVGKANGEEIYTFFPGPREFLKRVGIEPITIEIRFVGGKVDEIAIYGNDESENVVLKLRRFKSGVNLDEYFSLDEDGYPKCLSYADLE